MQNLRSLYLLQVNLVLIKKIEECLHALSIVCYQYWLLQIGINSKVLTIVIILSPLIVSTLPAYRYFIVISNQ